MTILSRAEPLVTSDHVLVESWLLIRHRLGRGDRERDVVDDGAGAEADAQVVDIEQACHDLRVSKASRRASPINVSSSMVTTSTAKVGKMIHQASRLALPWRSKSPSDGVVGGTPMPKKSNDVNARMAALMRNGKFLASGWRGWLKVVGKSFSLKVDRSRLCLLDTLPLRAPGT